MIQFPYFQLNALSKQNALQESTLQTTARGNLINDSIPSKKAKTSTNNKEYSVLRRRFRLHLVKSIFSRTIQDKMDGGKVKGTQEHVPIHWPWSRVHWFANVWRLLQFQRIFVLFLSQTNWVLFILKTDFVKTQVY